MKAKLQKFGGSLYTPVLFTAFAGVMAGLSIIFKDQNIVGSLANEGSIWFNLWSLIGEGAWTIFRQMPIIFVVGIPIAMAKKAPARASMEAILCYLTFNYYIQQILRMYGPDLGIDILDISKASGLTQIAGITTFDMSILGAIIIALLTSYIHDKFFDYELPEFVGTFSGSVFVYIIMFFILIPVAIITVFIWPQIQHLITQGQFFIVKSGAFGVWLYTFLERLLIPTGLHHLVYQPFEYANIVVDGGSKAAWVQAISGLQETKGNLAQLFPAGGYMLFGNAKVFGTLGMSLAFYFTAKNEKKKKTLGLLIPITLTAMLVGVTEPFEFTFLFIAPFLFLVHSILAATMATIMFLIGLSGDFGAGLINFATMNWLPLGANHYMVYIYQVVIGLIFTGIYFIVFKFLIIKMNLKTPGREDGEDVKFYKKSEFKEKQELNKDDKKLENIKNYIILLGGPTNIVEVSNCATRLRLKVKDTSILGTVDEFKENGAHGLVINDNAVQVIIGLKVAQLRDVFENELENQRREKNE